MRYRQQLKVINNQGKAGNRRETETFQTLQKEASKDQGIKYEEGITEEVRSGSWVEGKYTDGQLTLGEKKRTLFSFLESRVKNKVKGPRYKDGEVPETNRIVYKIRHEPDLLNKFQNTSTKENLKV